MSMRGSRESRSGAPNSSDLLVCFPSRAHLTLMPKTICSPARPCEPSKRHGHGHSLSLSNYNKSKSLLKRTRTRGGHGSPVLWAKTKSSMGQEMEMEEPTSPKVTCAGQIRVRPKNGGGACKNWQSVMEEIERIHKKGRQKKKPSWMEALGLKKDVMHFLTCLRTLRFDFSCFGSLPAGAHDITSDDDEDDDDDDDEEEEDHADGGAEDKESSRTVFSKWFMVLQEEKEKEKEKIKDDDHNNVEVEGEGEACVPPTNALFLMRCRSAPAKSWLEEIAEEEEEDERKYEEEEKGKEDKEKEKEKENSVLMRYDTEYYKISSDIAKETWVVGGMGDVLARSRSCKR